MLLVILIFFISNDPTTTLALSVIVADHPSSSQKNHKPRIVLWNTIDGGTPYAQRAWIALLEQGFQEEDDVVDHDNEGASSLFEMRRIDLSKPKPTELVEKYTKAFMLQHASSKDGPTMNPDETAALSTVVRAKVPLLEHDDELVIESDIMTRYICEHVVVGITKRAGDGSEASSGILLYDDERIERFLPLWNKVQDEYYNIVRAENEEQVQTAVAAFQRALQQLESSCFPNESTNKFVCGDTFSLAECLSAPWIQRCFVILPYFRNLDIMDELSIASDAPNTVRWMKAVCQRPSVQGSASPDQDMIAINAKYYIQYITPGSPAAAAAQQD